MKIKTKILGTLLVMSLLVALVGALAVDRQRASVTTAATKEAENVGNILGFIFLSDSNQLHSSTQEIITRLHKTQGRDIVLMDSHKRDLADANPWSVGEIYTDDQHDEVAATIRDGKVRTFVEISKDYPLGIKQIVVPVKSNSRQTIGAVVLEYTPLYNELMQLTKTTMRQIASATFGSVAFAFLIAFFMGRSVAKPLQQLTEVATAFAAGKTDFPLPPPRADEIGQLAVAFDNMVQKRRQAEEALRHARDELEVRVDERTAELAKTNEALQMENIERKRAEQKLNVEYAISRILAESPSWEQAIREVLQTLCGILNWDAGSFWMMDHRAGVLRCGELWSASEIQADEFKKSSQQTTFARGIGLPGRVWECGKPAWVRDVVQDANFPRAAVTKKAGLHGAFAFPVLIGNGVGGVIEFFSREIRELDEDLLQSFANVGNQLGQFFERKRVEGHLLQSQKMETVGKLAGGIAHEFNSIMTAIIGQSELLLDDLPPGNPLAKNATEINKAAGRAATLTRQLLAFGRKQILQPEILGLNAVIVGMENMLLHLMGRSVEVCFNPAAGLKSVKADAGQIEQVVVNIAMNAADAMPNGGKLTIETANVTLDADYVSRFPELKAGEYTMLAIGDTGAGMGDEVKARVFEPFFTTKGVGKGTGLGLATCHGIIKQSGGHIAVYSELGRGTTFKIYLPQVESEMKPPAQPKPPSDLQRGTETILLVEDDPSLREMAATLLERWGYTVLAAANGVEAMSLVHQQGRGHIDLLFTDVVMPQMSGNELSDRIHALHPQTKILFTSAYTESVIVHQGVLNPGVALLQKPFTPSALAHKVREILDV